MVYLQAQGGIFMGLRRSKASLYIAGLILLGLSAAFLGFSQPASKVLAITKIGTNNNTVKTRTTDEITITKDNFLDYFQTNGTAKYDPNSGITTLTTDSNWQNGSVTLKQYIDFTQNFTLSGSINLGANAYGADGIGVGFHPGDLTLIGTAGGALGFGDLANAFGWKADTYYNNAANGPYTVDPLTSAFGSFVYTDTSNRAISYMGPEAPALEIPRPSNNTFVPFTLTYTYDNSSNKTSKMLHVEYAGKIWERDVSDWIGTNLTEAFFITGSTGVSHNLQQVKVDSFSYTSKDSQANITGNDITIHVGDKIPDDDEFNAKATDVDGNPINVTVDTSKVNTSKPGIYETYLTAADGQTLIVHVYVLDDTKVNAHDTTVNQNDQWQPTDSFDNATDELGGAINFDNITVTYGVNGPVDTSRPGDYQVTYTAPDGTSKTIVVTVKPLEPGVIVAHDSTIIAGPKQVWHANDNFDSATNSDKSQLDLKDITVSGTVDPSRVADYPVTYTFEDTVGNQITKEIIVHVVASQASIDAADSIINVGDQWDPQDNFKSGTDALGNFINISDIMTNGSVDTTKPGDYQITYVYTDIAGNTVTKTITVHVIEKAFSNPITSKPSESDSNNSNPKLKNVVIKSVSKTSPKRSAKIKNEAILPQTNEKDSCVVSIIGLLITGIIVVNSFRKRRTI